MHKSFRAFAVALMLTITAIPAAAAMTPINFAVPPWPGAMVKAEVATQILEAVGYKTATTAMGTSDAYMALEDGNVDVFMSVWLPTQKMLLAPLLKKKAVHVAGVNVDNAKTGLCVPGYTSAEGVESLADLAPNGEKFDYVIHNIDPGSGMYIIVEKYIRDDFEGLGKWKQEGESVDTMLKTIIEAFKEKKWVVFSCWEPHWMNLTLDMHYLKGVKGSGALIAASTVNTVIRPAIKTRYPDAYMILSRINVSKKTQGKWTYDVSLKKQSIEETATAWIKGNLDVVRQWLGNLKAANGKKAVDVIETKF